MFNLTSDAQMQSLAKYRTKFDRIEIMLPKGHKKTLKEHAKQFQPQEGEPGKTGFSPQGSVTAFIVRAIQETIERDKDKAEKEKEPELNIDHATEEAEAIPVKKPAKKRGRPKKNTEMPQIPPPEAST